MSYLRMDCWQIFEKFFYFTIMMMLYFFQPWHGSCMSTSLNEKTPLSSSLSIFSSAQVFS